MKTIQPRYIAYYFVYVNGSEEQRFSSFRGTKRSIINRLKKLNPRSYTDGLEIRDDEDNLLWGEDGVIFVDDFFSDDEWFEVSGQRWEIIVDTEESCTEGQINKQESRPLQIPISTVVALLQSPVKITGKKKSKAEKKALKRARRKIPVVLGCD